MKIIIDKYIPYIQGVLEPYAGVKYLSPDDITPETVRDADALVVRTRTRIDGNLLSGSKCRFIATATIGRDHIDECWCENNDVTAVSAPGCNAPAVAQYVMASLLRLLKSDMKDTTVAIVGVGNVGGLIERWCRSLGFKVMLVDPMRAICEPEKTWYTLEEAAASADVITFHVPLTRDGEHATLGLGSQSFFEALVKRPIVINTSRGAVVDNAAWLQAIREGRLSASVADVWEGEPHINLELMKAVDIATPHIAGYSRDGKIRATQMVLDALSRHFELPALKADSRDAVAIPAEVTVPQILESYNPFDDSHYMRSVLLSQPSTKNGGSFDGRASVNDAYARQLSDIEVSKRFEELRDNYPLRNEISSTN